VDKFYVEQIVSNDYIERRQLELR